ncbi:hypothetical protein EV659_11226 [Rhodothalassium salexigens DSM 2132]|uniref:Uncharacterized protein n=1 Tax=Rhodothalassium salexigens DSM 2132 TaxID=1188247 RepID=A0A4R2P8E0_RHOSA|nr:hypothetical protein [Rhodothalassium salexigens]MBB4212552.1 hypothetical protein [Rhodothalassium salexigens DSM 2132]MBK1639896.1 hypothetical protein [Rhodothalassium salexigens DSM 2132]TCP31097.1 hypothetical protein EV659_11226 [Rhodothalassium salexigens DSM 2132]
MSDSAQAMAPADAERPALDDPHVYDNLGFTRAELAAAMRATYAELIAFVTQPAFVAIYNDLWSRDAADRPRFVNEVIVNRAELERRGVDIPEGILVQTSAFGDRRPTLFAVKKFLPDRFHDAWENVNLTFDNEYDDAAVSRDPEMAWRRPLPVSIQNTLLAEAADLDAYPDVGAGDRDWSRGLGDTYYERDG